jgi:hypothetical protein
MDGFTSDVIKVADTQVQHLAQQSQVMDQETRVSIYTFSFLNDIQCLVYDKDVLRLPSIAGLYHAYGNTALASATTLAVNDLALTSEKYGDHSFLIYVITDGMENASDKSQLRNLPKLLTSLPDHWTVAAFAPGAQSVHFLKNIGFPAGNITIWNPNEENGFLEVGQIIRQSTDSYMQARSTGVRGSKSIFNLKPVKVQDIKKALTPLTKGSYTINKVPADGRIDDFVNSLTTNGYIPGKSFYQLTKLETIQSNKQIAIRVDADDTVYMGDAARTKLGLPDGMAAKAKPGDYKDYTIFVQSGSYNRKLIGGTECLILR